MDKEQIAIERLKEAALMSERYYKKPLVVTTSGGKDSSVCVELAQRAGIDFEVSHNLTTADAPETVYFVRDEFKRLEEKGIKCTINKPVYKGKRTNMWDLIVQKMIPPTRTFRYCCSVLKEQSNNESFIVTGVRWAESVKRKNSRGIYEKLGNKENRIILNNDNDDKRMLFENCTLKSKRVCNPIIDWTDKDVFDFLNSNNIPTNPLYQCGFNRVGCIGCPLSSTVKRYFEFARYPKYKNGYIRAFERMQKNRTENGKDKTVDNMRWGKTGKEIFHWWMEDGVIPGQTSLYDEEDEEN